MKKQIPQAIQFGIDQSVCGYCRNRLRHECVTLCAPEGKYQYFYPVDFTKLDSAPKLPEYRKFRLLPPETRLAIVYLALHFLRQQFT